MDAVSSPLQSPLGRFKTKYLFHAILAGCLKLPTWLPNLPAEHIATLNIWVMSLRDEETMDPNKQPASSAPSYVASKPSFYIQTSGLVSVSSKETQNSSNRYSYRRRLTSKLRFPLGKDL